MEIIQLTRTNYDEVTASDKPLLIDFYADWCGPCKMLSPIIDQIGEERDDIQVCRVNIDDEPKMANQFGISAVPTLVVMKGGQVTNTGVGFMPKERVLALL